MRANLRLGDASPLSLPPSPTMEPETLTLNRELMEKSAFPSILLLSRPHCLPACRSSSPAKEGEFTSDVLKEKIREGVQNDIIEHIYCLYTKSTPTSIPAKDDRGFHARFRHRDTGTRGCCCCF